MPMPTMQQVNGSSSNNNSRFQDKMLDSDYLFSPERIKKLNWDNHCASYDPEISPLQPGDGLLVRPLHIDDFQKGYLGLLSQLTTVGAVTKEQFLRRFRSMQKCSNTYFIAVVEDLHKRAVVASCTLVVEQKFIHDAGQRGRIEDVVVGNEYRGKQLGKLYGNVVKQLVSVSLPLRLVDALTVFARELGCYKISLECKDKLVGFYETFGFRKDAGNNFMISRI